MMRQYPQCCIQNAGVDLEQTTLHEARIRSACLLAILPVILSMPNAASAADSEPSRFSAMGTGIEVPGWEILKPARDARDTRYSLVRDAGAVVLKADSADAMSGLIHPVKVDIQKYPKIRWRWKIAGTVPNADMTRKSGDDYAARIYVMFDYPVEKLPFTTRAKLKLAEKFYGQKIPAAALNYVWDGQAPVGTIMPNAYTDRARMIVLQSGAERAGEWVTEIRDLGADFRAAFGEEPPNVIAVALATDTDNTHSAATAWYGDIEFLPASQ